MPVSQWALIDLPTAKTWLGVPSGNTSFDALITLIINGAADKIEKFCDRRLAKRTGIVWIASGRRDNKLMTREWPILNIQQLFIDNSPLSNAGKFAGDTLIPNTDYDIDDFQTSVVYQKGVFPVGFSNIKLVYDAGYDKTIQPGDSNYEPSLGLGVPGDLIQASLHLVEWLYRHRDRGDIGRKSKGKGDENTLMVEDIPEHIQSYLLDYKRTEFPASDAAIYNQ